ncbi:lipase [Streptococcus iniae]|uniref:GDSL-type esterase/lipase family protein n=1 Tax=Streptococcus iniae TaxID=1346 RepID=UPI0008D8E75D|nr:GDSL-type esterase/lipase family protein [Streptococcus iniae]OHX27615.1 lipase [Streptococcus iniae]RLV27835.1 lipase [Streptococcus iniae]
MIEVLSEELKAYQLKLLKSYRIKNTNIVNDAIYFLGDSIIEFYPIKKYLSRDLPLYNRGIAGIDSFFMEKHLEDYFLGLEAKQVFILIGTNDLGLGHTISEIKTNIVDIIVKMKSDNIYCNINLISVLPVSDLKQFSNTVKVRNNKTIDELNKELATIPGINFIDVSNSFKNVRNALDESYTNDGLHLNDSGYQRLSQELIMHLN